MTGAPSAAQALARRLRAHGVTQVFGIPGVHNVELYRDLASTGLAHVLTRHEQGAGFMADGFARASGRPAACFVITGPGLTNVMTPMGQAYSDSVPMIVISSVIERRDIGRGRGRLHEMIDQEGAAASVCAWSATADTPANAIELIDRAFAGFACARPRPVHVQIPLDVLRAPAEPLRALPDVPARPRPDAGAVARAADALAGAGRVVMILGGGAIDARAKAVAIAERLGAAVLTTVAGKGIVPDGHPRSLGPALPRESIHALVREADAVLAVGTELAETDYWTGTLEMRGTLVRVDLDPHALADRHGTGVAVLGDARATLAGILERLPPAPAAAPGYAGEEVAAARRTAREAALAERPVLGPAIEALRRALPDEAIVASDMTEIAYLANEIFPVSAPRRWLHPVGFGTLGYALPAAIGAKLGAPDAPVAALAGDFGFHYTVQELGTAVELGLPVPIVVWNNEALAEIAADMGRKGIDRIAVKARNPDFVALAHAFGAHAARPASLTAFEDAVRAALTANGPTLIELTPAALA